MLHGLYLSWILLLIHIFKLKKIRRTLKGVIIITQGLRGQGYDGEVDSTEQWPKGRMNTFSNAPVICNHDPLELGNGGR